MTYTSPLYSLPMLIPDSASAISPHYHTFQRKVVSFAQQPTQPPVAIDANHNPSEPQCSPEDAWHSLKHSSILVNMTLQQDAFSMVGDRLPPKTGAVVTDISTGTWKVGFMGQTWPTYTMDTIVGFQSKKSATTGLS